MATYLWSTLANGQVIDPFNPSSDVLRFDPPSLHAAGITVDGVSVPGSTRFSDGAKTVTVHVALFAITTANVTFADTSLLLVGDNTTGTGNDNLPHTLVGTGANDHLIGGAGTDTLDGGAGADRMEGGGGDDTYRVDSAGDVIIEASSGGHDVVISSGNYVLDPNIEDLRLVAGTAPQNGGGNDSANMIDGNDGANTLTGGAGNDTINGMLGDDTLRGDAGDDALIGGPGADVLDGGAGADVVHYNRFGSGGIVVNLANPSQNTGEAAGDTFISIERIVGTSFGNDTLIGDSGPNRLYGLNGNNVLYGGAGDDLLETLGGQDVLHGGPGADVLRGGGVTSTGGFDYASYSTATAGVLADIVNPALNTGDAKGDTYDQITGLIGSGFDDALYGNDLKNDIAGQAGNDFLDGRGGDDNVQGGAGNDTLKGSAGNDILAGDAGADSLDGGAGTDAARYDKATAAVTADLSNPSHNAGDAAGDTYISVEDLIGSAFNDLLIGDNGNNFIRGDPNETGTGNDVMYGGGGNDTFGGFGGNDTAFGGDGDDFLNGGDGVDVFEGGPGADGFFGGGGGELDYMRYSGAASGVVVSLADASMNTGDAAGDFYKNVEGIIGSRFDDRLLGDAFDNDLAGLDGNDYLDGAGGANNLQGGNGDDVLLHGVLDGGPGADSLSVGIARYSKAVTGVTANLSDPSQNTGEAAGDTYSSISGLIGSAFADVLVGATGEQVLTGGAGADVLNGGSGIDTAGYSNAAAGVVANLGTPSQNTGDAAGDSYISIEGLIGSGDGDTLIGDAGANVIDGGGGNDSVQGRDGDDTLIGGDGNDQLDGGAGADRLIGGNGFDYARYSSASEAAFVDLGNFNANGGAALGDILDVEGAIGTAFNDTLKGNANANDLAGLAGNDRLEGWEGDDNLQGGDGNDRLFGGTGNDVLAGDAGADMLDGESGINAARYDKAPTGVVVNLADPTQNTGHAAGDSYLNIQIVIGSSFADTLIGGADADTLRGSGGDDTLRGGAGNDRLMGEQGSDSLEGGGGSDQFVFRRGEAQGDRVVDFSGSHPSGDGDQLQFEGFGNAASGATFTQVDATHWSINSSDGAAHEIITLTNGATVAPTDYTFI